MFSSIRFSSVLFFVFSAMLLLVASCSSDEERKKKIQGEWRGVSWVIDESSYEYSVDGVMFSFSDDGYYHATLGEHAEAGTYRFRGQNLLTRAEGMSEMGVRILRFETDTLVLHMNRSGQLETLTLARSLGIE